MTTAYYSHPDCRAHDMGRGHPECPQRLDAIEDYLLASGLDVALQRRAAAAPGNPHSADDDHRGQRFHHARAYRFVNHCVRRSAPPPQCITLP